ncbi:UNVERIFIED_CONTAM: hypothetical protein ABID98_000646 [Brevibacillus sp. OAP136]
MAMRTAFVLGHKNRNYFATICRMHLVTIGMNSKMNVKGRENMRKNRAALAMSMLCCLLAGCGMNASPADLVRSPKMDAGQQEVSQALSIFLPLGAKMVVPRRPDNQSAVTEIDFDGDGQDEVVVNYKEERNDYEINTLVLGKTAKGWEKRAELKGLAQDLDYFSAVDVTGDKRPEVVIGYSGGDNLDRELDVYAYRNGGMQQMWKQPYKAMDVGDLTGGGTAEIAIMEHDHDKMTASAALYDFLTGKPHKLDELPTEGAINGYNQALIGPAAPGRNALFVDAGIGAHSEYTALIMWQNGKMQNVLKKDDNDTALTFKTYPLASADANGDGIVEIGLQTEPAGSEQLAIVEIPFIESWYQWDGKNGLKLVGESYSDYGAGFTFTIPDNWRGKFTLQREQGIDNGSVVFLYLPEFPQKKVQLMRLLECKRSDWTKVEQDLKKQGAVYGILSQNKTKLVIAVQPADEPAPRSAHREEYQQMRLTLPQIKQFFRTF